MTEPELIATIKTALFSVAPELEDEEIDPTLPFRDQFDIDSMDFLNFIIALHDSTGVDIPEADYPKLSTMDGSYSYLISKLR